MPIITRALLKKRAEHNESVVATLEEISLHQEELECINEMLGSSCRKLKILYLQNNIIPKMENLHHLKDLQYLNLALNNISKIEGLQNCEFLNKLDLTVNFVDVDELKSSMEHLATRFNLKDLYMMGNPCQANWPGFEYYAVAKLPQLQTLDGKEITRSLQIQARQKLPQLEAELSELAIRKVSEKQSQALQKPKINNASDNKEAIEDSTASKGAEDSEQEDRDTMTENTPEARIEIYRELAQQKKEKEDRATANAPKQRDYEAEQQDAVAATRQKKQATQETEIKQKNEGGLDFFWDEESRPGFVLLEVRVPRHLDSSLIDVDVHPSFVSVVIKSKVLRLRLPAEVKSDESKCQRSKTTGALLVVMPKVNSKDAAVTVRASPAQLKSVSKSKAADGTGLGTRRLAVKKLSLQDELMQAAAGSTSTSHELLDQPATVFRSSVDVTRIVPRQMVVEESAPTSSSASFIDKCIAQSCIEEL